MQKVLILQPVIVQGRIDLLELLPIVLLKASEERLLAGDRPNVIYRRLEHVRHARDKRGSAIGLGAYGRSIGPMDVDFRIDAGPLAQAHHDVAKGTVAETNRRQRRVFHFNVRMREVRPFARDFVDRPHQPLQNIQVMRRLVDQHAAAFGGPFAAPWVGLIVSLIAPTEHHHRTQNRLADLALVDGRFHPQHGLKEAPLADHAHLNTVPVRCGNHAVAILQARRQRLFHQHMHVMSGGQDRRGGMQRMRCANHHRFDAGFGEHRRRIRVRAHRIPRREGCGARTVLIAHRRELAFGQIAQRGGVNVPYLAAADDRCFHAAPGKYCALISRRNLSEATISSIPFMPSSRLIQPRYWCAASKRKIA